MIDRWEKNLEMLKSGALGDVNSPEALLLYWQMQERAGYPNASENVKYFEDMVKKESYDAEMGYIKREDAIDAVLFALVGTGHQSKAICAIKFVPTADLVSVVRCKDCKFRYTGACRVAIWECGELLCDTEDNDFCNYGEGSEE